jgi:hypothetical protein
VNREFGVRAGRFMIHDMSPFVSAYHGGRPSTNFGISVRRSPTSETLTFLAAAYKQIRGKASQVIARK